MNTCDFKVFKIHMSALNKVPTISKDVTWHRTKKVLMYFSEWLTYLCALELCLESSSFAFSS